jgi:hypothetical protein
MAQGGLEGCKPSMNHSFLMLVAGFAGNEHQSCDKLRPLQIGAERSEVRHDLSALSRR